MKSDSNEKSVQAKNPENKTAPFAILFVNRICGIIIFWCAAYSTLTNEINAMACFTWQQATAACVVAFVLALIRWDLDVSECKSNNGKIAFSKFWLTITISLLVLLGYFYFEHYSFEVPLLALNVAVCSLGQYIQTSNTSR